MPFCYDEMQSSHYNYVFYCLDMLNLMFSVDSTGILFTKIYRWFNTTTTTIYQRLAFS